MSLLIVVLCSWSLIVLFAVALCVQAGRADDTAESAGVTPAAGHFNVAA